MYLLGIRVGNGGDKHQVYFLLLIQYPVQQSTYLDDILEFKPCSVILYINF